MVRLCGCVHSVICYGCFGGVSCGSGALPMAVFVLCLVMHSWLRNGR